MNRRSFLAGILSAAVAPMFLKGAGRKWVSRESGIIVPNPEYAKATHELSWCFSAVVPESELLLTELKPIFHKRSEEIQVPPKYKLIEELYPIRMDENNNPIWPEKVIQRREYHLT